MCFRNCIDVIIMSLYTACSSHNVDAMVQAEDVVVAVVIDGGGLEVMAMVMVVRVMGILGKCFSLNLGRLDSGWKAFWC